MRLYNPEPLRAVRMFIRLLWSSMSTHPSIHSSSTLPLFSLKILREHKRGWGRRRGSTELPHLVRIPVICQSSWPQHDFVISQKACAWQSATAGEKLLVVGKRNIVHPFAAAKLHFCCILEGAGNSPMQKWTSADSLHLRLPLACVHFCGFSWSCAEDWLNQMASYYQGPNSLTMTAIILASSFDKWLEWSYPGVCKAAFWSPISKIPSPLWLLFFVIWESNFSKLYSYNIEDADVCQNGYLNGYCHCINSCYCRYMPSECF